MNFKSLPFFLLAGILSFCSSPKKPLPEVDHDFKTVLDVHGDWSKWVNAKAFSYTLFHETNLTQENHFFNLESRKGRIDATNFQIGFDGEKTWISPNRAAFEGPSVQFYHNLYFNFFSIPYILTEPGVTVSKTENRMLNGKSYETFNVIFEDNVKGFNSKDTYIMLVDPESHRLEWVLYTLTFFDTSDTQLGAMKYDDYRNADGLVFPRILTAYLLEGDSTTRIRSQVSFADVVLSEDELKESLFEMPEKYAVLAN